MNVGIVGCGHVSDQYLEGCARFDAVRVIACADLDLDRARTQAARFGVPRALAPDELMADPDVELIVNLTPPQAHAQTSLDAVAHGKHVWSEKPLGVDPDDGRRILAAAAAAGVRVGCAPDTFLGGGLQTARKLVDDGWIGDPVAAVAFVSEHGYEHFHPNVDFFYDRGGGPALDLGPYYVTALVTTLGPVARVAGFAGVAFPERTILTGPRAGEAIPVRVPTHVTGTLELESGLPVAVLMSWDLWSTHLPYVEIYGSRGSLSLPNPDEFGGSPLLRIAAGEEREQPPPRPGAVPWTPVPLVHDGTVGRGIGVADMVTALAAGRPHRAGGELALHVLEVLCAFERSYRERCWVDVDSTCERPRPLAHGELG